MSLTFWPGTTATNGWRSGAISAGPAVTGTVITGTFPVAHTVRGESLYSVVYLKYHPSFSIQSISDISAGVRTATFNVEHGFQVGDVITIAGTTSCNESGRTITAVPNATSFKYSSGVAAGNTGGALGTAALTTARTYNNIIISATMAGGAKSSNLIGLANNKNTAVSYSGGYFSPATVPTLLAGQSFGTKITVPSGAVGTGLASGDWLPIVIKRTANTNSTFTSKVNPDVGTTLSVTATY